MQRAQSALSEFNRVGPLRFSRLCLSGMSESKESYLLRRRPPSEKLVDVFQVSRRDPRVDGGGGVDLHPSRRLLGVS